MTDDRAEYNRIERLRLTKVMVDDETGCWNWLGATTAAGYGTTAARRGSKNSTTAHRAFWSAYVGPIPTNEVLHHKCANRRCVNVDHLQLMTSRENAAEMFERNTLIRARESAEQFVDGALNEIDDVIHQNREGGDE